MENVTNTELTKMLKRFIFIRKEYAEFGAELYTLGQLTDQEEIKEQFKIVQAKCQKLQNMLTKWKNGEKLKGYENL